MPPHPHSCTHTRQPFEETINTKWKDEFASFSETFTNLRNFQRNWLYLKPIFSSADIQTQLPREVDLFGKNDARWRGFMSALAAKPKRTYAQVASNQLIKSFEQFNEELERIIVSLRSYLNTKRQRFPRFYFLSVRLTSACFGAGGGGVPPFVVFRGGRHEILLGLSCLDVTVPSP